VPAGFIDRVSVYLPAPLGMKVMDEIAQFAQRGRVGEVMLNPGADDLSVVDRATELGLNVVTGCALIALGVESHEGD